MSGLYNQNFSHAARAASPQIRTSSEVDRYKTILFFFILRSIFIKKIQAFNIRIKRVVFLGFNCVCFICFDWIYVLLIQKWKGLLLFFVFAVSIYQSCWQNIRSLVLFCKCCLYVAASWIKVCSCLFMFVDLFLFLFFWNFFLSSSWCLW
jgi:hypothetical protein